jgi:hypothetical protein
MRNFRIKFTIFAFTYGIRLLRPLNGSTDILFSFLKFDLNRIPIYSGFGFNRISFYSRFSINTIPFYSESGLKMFYCTNLGSVKTGLTVLQKLDLFIQVDKYISTFLIINLVYLCIVNYLYRSFKDSNVNVVYLMQIPARDTILFFPEISIIPNFNLLAIILGPLALNHIVESSLYIYI